MIKAEGSAPWMDLEASASAISRAHEQLGRPFRKFSSQMFTSSLVPQANEPLKHSLCTDSSAILERAWKTSTMEGCLSTDVPLELYRL